MRVEDEILDKRIEQKAHLLKSIRIREEDLETNDLLKSFSSDLSSRYPKGIWRTINGASVFINNGKVVAGLGGFNGMIDDYFSVKKEGENKAASEKNSEEGKYKHVVQFEDNTYTVINHDEKLNKVELRKIVGNPSKIKDFTVIDMGSDKKETKDQPKEEEKKEDKPKKEEKYKLSPRAKQVLKDSQKTFDQSSSLRQIELYDLVKKNIGIDKNGKEKIGMGLDEDMVAAGNEFLKKNEKAYNEAKALIQSRKDFKKEESKQKATKDVSNIEKIALQQNKEMEDKIKSVSSSASVKEKLEVVKQINSKIDSLSKESLYNSKTNQYNTKMVDNMIDVLQNIDEKYLSKEQKNEMDDIKESLDTLVSIDKYIPAEKGKKSKYEHDYFLKEHGSLGDKLKALNERLKYESDDKGDYDPQKHGSLSSFEEEVENVQKFLGNVKKDYVSKQATELLNYKLF